MPVEPVQSASTLVHSSDDGNTGESSTTGDEVVDGGTGIESSIPEWNVEVPRNLAAVPTRELRQLSNHLYQRLSTAMPPFGTREDYLDVSEELERRAIQAQAPHNGDVRPTAIQDNTHRSRYELFDDGVLIGTLSYQLHAGRLALLNTVMTADYDRPGRTADIIRPALLNAHRRRLAVLPYCPRVQEFLNANPQYWSLTARA